MSCNASHTRATPAALEPGASGDRRHAATRFARFTLDALRAFARSKGFAQPDVAAAVAMAESGGNASALGDNGDSYGLWQINVPSHPEYDRAQLFNPTYNAAAALLISAGGTNWQPWTTFRSGAYLPYMPQGAAAS